MNTKVDIKHSFETNNGSSSEKIQWKKIKEYLDEFGITLFYCGSNSYFGVPNSWTGPNKCTGFSTNDANTHNLRSSLISNRREFLDVDELISV